MAECKRQANSTQGSDWASLPLDIIDHIAGRLLEEDGTYYISLRAVCSSWRSSTASPRDGTLRDRRFHPRRWVALCDGDGVRPADAGAITFFHTSAGRRLLVRLPELQGHRIVGITDGLVILLDKDTAAVRVLHPFTRVVVELPSLASLFHNAIKYLSSLVGMRAAVCSDSTSITVVAWFPNAPVVVCAQPGDRNWVVIHQGIQVYSTLHFQGRLYGTTRISKQLVQLYPPNTLAPVIAQIPEGFAPPLICYYFLVESDGRMLLVVQHPSMDYRPERWQQFAFALFEVDVHRRELIPVSSIGDWALFLGKDRCLSVSAKDFTSMSSNSIYFSVPLYNPVVLYSLSSRLFQRTVTYTQIHDSVDRIRPSVRPFTLADHLLTYCHHTEWTRGLMFHEYQSVPQSWKEYWNQISEQDSELRVSWFGKVCKKG